eukprot:6179931-Pleurochrysis_carterae.AAC.1
MSQAQSAARAASCCALHRWIRQTLIWLTQCIALRWHLNTIFAHFRKRHVILTKLRLTFHACEYEPF